MGHSRGCESSKFYVTTARFGECNCGYEANAEAEQDALRAEAEAQQAAEAEAQYVADEYRAMGERGE